MYSLKPGDILKKVNKSVGLYTHKCFICGKVFDCGKDYVYKYPKKNPKRVKYFCSYKCMREFEKENPNEMYKWTRD